MGKTYSISSWGLWKGGFGVVVPVMRKLHTTFSRPKGVKQGHFVVIATEGWKPERFFIELGYLDHPDFVKLLKQAEEEFGFSQVGALAIPCEPDDLKRIIERKKNRNKSVTCWVKGIRVA
ncbi:auxin-responsive protein SAUR71-like [Abrus precatorius]|uniref:Auxin-responsive protein SAUR71-like n=1 Tax=Abrus precatorius TaxID=3816 RepID=A0A8B8L0P5_ABRPR|nr:auxin-responsive protein SAUR71-like [Abrus precatorius]